MGGPCSDRASDFIRGRAVYRLISGFSPEASFSRGRTWARKASTWAGHRPIYSLGSRTDSISASVMPKAGCAASRRSRSHYSPSFIFAVAAMEHSRMIS